jgi:hypothetical protein
MKLDKDLNGWPTWQIMTSEQVTALGRSGIIAHGTKSDPRAGQLNYKTKGISIVVEPLYPG